MKNNNSFDAALEVIGNKLYELRHSRKEKLTTIEKAIGVNHGTISEIENGKYKSLRIDTLMKFAEYYGVHLAEIIPAKE